MSDDTTTVLEDDPGEPLAWLNPLRDPADRRLPRIAGPSGLVIFGVTGDLSRKKLMPAVYDLANRGLLPPGFSLIGFARRDWEDEDFAQVVHDSVKEHARTPFREEVWAQLAKGMRFVQGEFVDNDAFEKLRETIEELDKEQGTGGNFAFYLSVPPKFFPQVVQQLKAHGLADPPKGSWRRAVIEKPFGHDLASAKELNTVVHSVFPRDEVFRIDHYLGKETVQNILALRFANSMFEPIWNRSYVDHVQITMAEDIGIGGRAGYYDGIGSARDVIQNHLLQLMALTAIEEPASFHPKALVAEKLKVLSAVKIPRDLGRHTVRGQYTHGWQGGEEVPGYLEEDGINPESTTDTYAAVKLEINNRRWAGVPFYLRTGKRLGRRVTEIAVVFQRAPYLPFDSSATEELGQNALVIRVQPDEGVTMRFGSKVPGTSMEVRDVNMDFAYGESFTESSPEAYERLILDVLLGDANLFPRHQEVEESWKILDPIEAYWNKHGKPAPYESGTWGPAEADEMLARDGKELAPAMKIDLTDTTSSKINSGLIDARRSIGAGAVGMVLTLVIVTDEGSAYDALKAASEASREHPSRILAVISRPGRSPRARAEARLDAEIRVGSDAGTGETVLLRLHGELAAQAQSVVLPLLLPDAPVVVWWPENAPDNPAKDPLGALAQRRITDAVSAESPVEQLATRAATYSPGDTDLAWTRLTPWRSMLAAALDQRHTKVESAVVEGESYNPSAELLALWLASRLKVKVDRVVTEGPGLTAVRLRTAGGDVTLDRNDGLLAKLSMPDQPDRMVALKRRETSELIAEELRRLDPDDIYATSVRYGVDKLHRRNSTTDVIDAPAEAGSAKLPPAHPVASPTRTKATPKAAAPKAGPGGGGQKPSGS